MYVKVHVSIETTDAYGSEVVVEEAVYIPVEEAMGLRKSTVQKHFWDQHHMDLGYLGDPEKFKWTIMVFPGTFQYIGQDSLEATLNERGN
jgi:hypothetical protein